MKLHIYLQSSPASKGRLETASYNVKLADILLLQSSSERRTDLGFQLFNSEQQHISEVVLTAGLFVLTTLVCAGGVHQRCTTKSEEAQVMEVVHPEKTGRKVANFDHCNCVYSADVLSHELLLNIL